jgi:hypothetical protein
MAEKCAEKMKGQAISRVLVGREVLKVPKRIVLSQVLKVATVMTRSACLPVESHSRIVPPSHSNARANTTSHTALKSENKDEY